MTSMLSATPVMAHRLSVAYAGIVIVAAGYLGITAQQAGQGTLGTWGSVLCFFAIASLALVPRFPAVALGVFILAAHGMPRYGNDFLALLSLDFLNWVSSLSLMGWIVWLVREQAWPRISNWPTLVMIAFVTWIGVTILAAAARGEVVGYFPRHHPSQFFQSLVLFLIAAHTLGERTTAWWFGLLLCAMPTVQAQFLGTSAIYLESDIPAVSAMILPAAVMGAFFAPNLIMRIAFSALALDMLRIITISRNRAAAVGLACAVALLWWNSGHRVRWTLVGAPLIVLFAWLLIPKDYVDRFRVLWDPQANHPTATLDRATVQGRLDLWDAGARMVRDHPLVGVGAGNYPHAIGRYRPEAKNLPTHSNVLNAAAETGIPGAMLYIGLFAGAIVMLQSVIRRTRPGWPEEGARMVQAALAAYLGVGLFLSRHDMQLAYLLLGWGVAFLLYSRDRMSQPPGGLARPVVHDDARTISRSDDLRADEAARAPPRK
jgi:hypothetical protein